VFSLINWLEIPDNHEKRSMKHVSLFLVAIFALLPSFTHARSSSSSSSISFSSKHDLDPKRCYENRQPEACHVWVRTSRKTCESFRLPAGSACGNGGGACTANGTCVDYTSWGPYTVGYRTEVLVDQSRFITGVFKNQSQTPARPIYVRVWYPGEPSETIGQPNARYDRANAVSSGAYSPIASTPSNIFLVMDRVWSNITAVGGQREFPLVVVSHGSNGDIVGMLPLPQHLASHGFIVVGMETTCNNAYVPRATGCLTAIPGITVGGFRDNYAIRPWDFKFVVDTVQTRSSTDAPGLPFYHADANRTAAVGHSTGTTTALAAACGLPLYNTTFPGAQPTAPADSRVRAVFLLDSIVLTATAQAPYNFSQCTNVGVFHFGQGATVGGWDNGFMSLLTAVPSTDRYWLSARSVPHGAVLGDGCEMTRACGRVLQASGLSPTAVDLAACGRGLESLMFCDGDDTVSGLLDNTTITTMFAPSVSAWLPYYVQTFRGMPLSGRRQALDGGLNQARATFATALFARHTKNELVVSGQVLTPAFASQRFSDVGDLFVGDVPAQTARPVDLVAGSSIRFTRASASAFGGVPVGAQLQGGYTVQYFASSGVGGASLQTPFGTLQTPSAGWVLGPTTPDGSFDVTLTMSGGFPLPDGQLTTPTTQYARVFRYGTLILGPFTISDNSVATSAQSVDSMTQSGGAFVVMPYNAFLQTRQPTTSNTAGVYVNNLSDRTVITWSNLTNFADSNVATVTFQCVLWSNGSIDFYYGSLATATTAYGIPYTASVGLGNGRLNAGAGHDHPVDFTSLTLPTLLDVGAIHETFVSQYPYVTVPPSDASALNSFDEFAFVEDAEHSLGYYG
jgi:hypothetical protein